MKHTQVIKECEMISESKSCLDSMSVFLIICRARMNILVIVKVKTLVIIKMVIYMFLPIMLTIHVDYWILYDYIFWECSFINFWRMCIWCQFLHPHLTTHYSNIGVHIFWDVILRLVYFSGLLLAIRIGSHGGLKSQVPLILANPKMKTKSQLLSLKKPLKCG